MYCPGDKSLARVKSGFVWIADWAAGEVRVSRDWVQTVAEKLRPNKTRSLSAKRRSKDEDG
jgi:hypothetical protein